MVNCDSKKWYFLLNCFVGISTLQLHYYYNLLPVPLLLQPVNVVTAAPVLNLQILLLYQQLWWLLRLLLGVIILICSKNLKKRAPEVSVLECYLWYELAKQVPSCHSSAILTWTIRGLNKTTIQMPFHKMHSLSTVKVPSWIHDYVTTVWWGCAQWPSLSWA